MSPTTTITIRLNGEPCDVSASSTVSDLLAERGLASQPCAVEINQALVPKRCHGEHRLAGGDSVEIVTLVGGG